MTTYNELLKQLETCPISERPGKIEALVNFASQPNPGKVVTAQEQQVIDDLRSEINRLAKDDPFANDPQIQANIKAIRRIEGRA